MASIRIGTRGSKLALWQAEWVAAQLQQRGFDAELVIISTQGDVSREPLRQVGGQGLFTKEIQRELLIGTVDVAVHSLKDLPTMRVEGLAIAAVPQRETTADCLISRGGLTFENLPVGARLGTGSARRGSQLLAWRSDIQIADIRGNVDSRLRKLEEGQYDAIILAAAGLSRLKMLQHVSEQLPETRILPAIGQGALGLECRSDDLATRAALFELDHAPSHSAVMAERAFLASLLAGCLAPVAAIARLAADGQLHLHGRVLSPDGRQMLEGVMHGSPDMAESVGGRLAEELKGQGAEQLIAAARG